MAKTDFRSVDEYIATFPADVQTNLEKIRQTIKSAVPEVEEVISYQMPAFKYHGYLVYISAFKRHYSLFIPQGPIVFAVFEHELVPYTISKSTLKFPLSEPIPFDLIAEMMKYKAEKNLSQAVREGRSR